MGFIKGFKELKRNTIERISPSKSEEDWFDSEVGDNNFDSVETDNWRWELEFSDIITGYIHTLRKERQNAKGQWKRLDSEKPFMNEQGISFVISSLQPILNKGTPMGVMDKKDFNKTVRVLDYAFKDKMILCHQEFEIEKTDIKPLVYGYHNMVRTILSRSINDGERKIRSKIFGYKDNYSHDEVNADEINGRIKL